LSTEPTRLTDDRIAGSGAFDGSTHIFPLRVYYEDTDAAGIVYYANYLKFAERARTELMRLLGAEHRTMMASDGVSFAVRACAVDYLQPARLDDAIAVLTRVDRAGGASIGMTQTVVRADGGDVTVLVAMTVRLACIDGRQRAARLPRRVRTALQKLVDGSPANGA
jgi:acyl-CoA thioester hydrolase